VPIGFDNETGGIAFISDECPDCGNTMYSTGCDWYGCDSMYCPDCSYGCDLDALGEEGECYAAMAEEDPEDRSERVNAERAAFGLSPIEGA